MSEDKELRAARMEVERIDWLPRLARMEEERRMEIVHAHNAGDLGEAADVAADAAALAAATAALIASDALTGGVPRSDEGHALAIKSTARALNDAIEAATNAGLFIELRVASETRKVIPFQVVQVTTARVR